MEKTLITLGILIVFGLFLIGGFLFAGTFSFSGMTSVDVSEEDFVETLGGIVTNSHSGCSPAPGYPDDCNGE